MKTLICIGDSLTEGTDIPVGHTWPALVGNTLNMKVVNCGIGGDTTAGMLARFHSEVVVRQPAFAFIMGGTNDLWWGLDINAILANLFSMVVQARHCKIAPVMALPLPVHAGLASQNDFSPPWDGYDRFTRQLERLTEKITRYAHESEVVLVDLYRPFFSDEGGVHGELFLADGLHPNGKGHQTVATTIGRTFSQQFLFPA